MKHIFERMVSGTHRLDDELLIILDALPIPLSWTSLADGHVRFVNRAFTKTFGYQNGRFATVDQWIDETYIDETEREQARQRWECLWIAEGEGITEIEPFEVRVRHDDGDMVPVLHRGIVLHDFGLGIATFEDLSSQKLAETTLRRIAYEDPLTGLANRRVLQERWDAEMAKSAMDRSRTMVALLMIDLDNFKPINDYFGHAAGDEILKKVATRLRQSVRHDDTVVRMGGDEFVILLTDLEDQAVAEKICQRIAEAFATPFTIQNQTIKVGATVGASLYPHHAGDLEALLHAADQALYRMKRSDKENWAWFDRSLEAANEPQLLSGAVTA
ncbi:diguanylate cyclase domain-containing protein [Agrobacterium rosae]|uniref:Sensor domain-containing diguanylate cyclase n=1 Tax=Agrobacterium rosae TaxID=1972867 RepID=A0AAE5RYM3_9HYPH|nr:sensor domain-containing diguanylate cyclase [Agrobacterium rosae]KAA3511461.1 diguanylate cyclase [Agrobacterium rosae]KAA3519115.1 diguanylate cyclase [Agrobacterium rosae]MCM2435348.1 sensor domain-containing diguanylate cyclase [Agrobacterium rosae]MDX8332218.1 sensor domain-containing diguanylate cyclase [Agrobacterium rosae]MQB49137.1 diguanylate cyclase [Agrobacterium rosae]